MEREGYSVCLTMASRIKLPLVLIRKISEGGIQSNYSAHYAMMCSHEVQPKLGKSL